MNDDINLVKDIYELSVGLEPMFEEKIGRRLSDYELIKKSIETLIINGNEEEKKKILGINKYIDYKIFSEEFTHQDMEKNLKIFDYVATEMKDDVISEKVSVLEEMESRKYFKRETSFVAVKLIKKYFSDKKEINQMMYFYRSELD